MRTASEFSTNWRNVNVTGREACRNDFTITGRGACQSDTDSSMGKREKKLLIILLFQVTDEPHEQLLHSHATSKL